MHRFNNAPYIKPGSLTYRNGKQTVTTLEPLVRDPPSNQPKVVSQEPDQLPSVSGLLAWKDKELGIRGGPRRGMVSLAGSLLLGCLCATKDPLSVSLTALKNAHIWCTLVCSAVGWVYVCTCHEPWPAMCASIKNPKTTHMHIANNTISTACRTKNAPKTQCLTIYLQMTKQSHCHSKYGIALQATHNKLLRDGVEHVWDFLISQMYPYKLNWACTDLFPPMKFRTQISQRIHWGQRSFQLGHCGGKSTVRFRSIGFTSQEPQQTVTRTQLHWHSWLLNWIFLAWALCLFNCLLNMFYLHVAPTILAVILSKNWDSACLSDSLWCNCIGWLGIKHRVNYIHTALVT